MKNHRRFFFLIVLCLTSQDQGLANEEHVIHGNTTRLCRNNCRISSIPFDRPFSIPSNCGDFHSFYACRVEIDVNFTRRTYSVYFSAFEENDIQMYFVDYDFWIDQLLNLAFFRQIFENNLIFTCLTENNCTENYALQIVPKLIDSEAILRKLPSIFLDPSTENRTFNCVNNSNEIIPCYGGYCESITQETSTWSFHDCQYPAESSSLSATELTSLTAIFFRFEPENHENEQVSDTKITLLCNVDLCNSEETRNRSKDILDEYNQAAFIFNIPETTSTSTLIITVKSTSNPPLNRANRSIELSMKSSLILGFVLFHIGLISLLGNFA